MTMPMRYDPTVRRVFTASLRQLADALDEQPIPVPISIGDKPAATHHVAVGDRAEFETAETALCEAADTITRHHSDDGYDVVTGRFGSVSLAIVLNTKSPSP